MSARTFSVGIVGAGAIAANIHIPALRGMNESAVAWILDADLKKAQALAVANGLTATQAHDRLADAASCDAVLLALPLPPRAPYFDALQPTQTAILAEKPLATFADDHRRLAAAFAPWRLAVGYQRRRYAANMFLRRAILGGLFGPLIEVRVNEGGRSTRTGGAGGYQDVPVADGGGVTKNLGCHSLDLLLWMTGAASYEIIDRQVEWDDRTDRRATAHIRLKGMNGVAGYDAALHWTVSWIDAQSNVMDLRFAHARLRASIGPDDRLTLLDADGLPLADVQAPAGSGAVTVTQACCLQWRELFSTIESKHEPSHSAGSTLRVAELMDELLQK